MRPWITESLISGDEEIYTHTHTPVIFSVDELLRARTALNRTEGTSQTENLFVFSPLRGGSVGEDDVGNRGNPLIQPLHLFSFGKAAMCHP